MRLWPESKVSRLERQIEELRAGFANPTDTFLESMGVAATYSGQRVSTDKALGMSAVYAEYLFFHYRFAESVRLGAGLPSFFDSRTIRVGVTLMTQLLR